MRAVAVFLSAAALYVTGCAADPSQAQGTIQNAELSNKKKAVREPLSDSLEIEYLSANRRPDWEPESEPETTSSSEQTNDRRVSTQSVLIILDNAELFKERKAGREHLSSDSLEIAHLSTGRRSGWKPESEPDHASLSAQLLNAQRKNKQIEPHQSIGPTELSPAPIKRQLKAMVTAFRAAFRLRGPNGEN